MVKRRRKRSSSGAASGAATDSAAGAIPSEADPLSIPPWPTAGCPEEEVAERERFATAWEAFRAGDFQRCRLEAAALASDATSEEVRLRAHALFERLRPDPLAIVVASSAFLLLVTAIAVTFG